MSAMFRPPVTASRPIGWRQVLGFDQPATGGEARFWAGLRGQQLAVLNRHAPLAAGLVLLDLVALGVVLRDGGDPVFAVAWGVVIGGLAGLWSLRWVRGRRLPVALEATPRQFWGLSAEVACFGIAWAAMMLHQLPMVTAENQLVLALISANVATVCGLSAASLPVCSIVLVSCTAAATLYGLPYWSPLATPLTWLGFLGLTIFVTRTILVSTSDLMARARSDADQDQARATIGSLLGELETHGTDWLIEVDANGRLTHASPRLCQASGRSQAALLDMALVGLIGPDRRDPAVRGAVRKLGAIFAERRAFTNLVVPVAVRGELRWWSISGTPLNDGGRFAGFRGVGTDVTEARRAEDRIVELARYDPLTGLANRALVRETIAAELPGGCALLFVDLDRFKLVNDTLGHLAGDRLLREVATRLRHVAGEGARIGRLGGDEFAVVLVSPSPARAERLARAIVDSLSRPYDLEGQSVSIGASVGYAMSPEDGATVDTLLRCADLALYEVKRSGRGAACRFATALQLRAEERRVLEVDLMQALDRGELSLAFQPIVEASDERIVGFEALLRWTHPVLGMIAPLKFIPVAEDTGAIIRIGEWVLREACAWAARWPEDIRIAVNLSPLQFEDADLPRVIAQALAENGIAPDRLELEITESVFLAERSSTMAMIARLKALGVRFALDDFGTGYSALGYLRKAEFSRIKIDRSFVQRAAECESESTAIIQAIVALANSLGMATTAEGTETRAEFEACRSLGCGQVQGYLFGHPMPPEAATALVAPALVVRTKQAALVTTD
jgi:diguanylate cyclase (GGDEF)-like protein/PAS domain S-box-containing protein